MADRTQLGNDRREVAGVVQRPRLFAMLDVSWPPICVVRAPSGSGKTTLLRGWAVARSDPSPLLWVTISAEVGSRTAFWTRVAGAAQRSGQASADTVATLVERMATSTDPVEVATEFLSDAGPVTLVLDAYEKVGEAIAGVDRDLLRIAEELPQLRVIVAARGHTGLADDALLLRDRVRVIDDDDLAFTEAEVIALLAEHLGRDEPSLAASIARSTRGYALSVRASVMALARRATVPVVNSEEWRSLVATDLRATLPDQAMGRFVALTSVPPYFDAALARQITGRSEVGQVLAVLERQGFGRWIPYARQHPMFQYVDSIRETFVAELRHESPDAYERSADRAARWLFAHGDHETAFDLSLTARNYSLAVRIYLDLLREYPECYLTDRLIGPLGSLPHAVLRQYPMLAFALGLARLTHPVLRSSAPEAFELAVSNPSRSRMVGPDQDGFINRSMRAVSLRLIRRFADAARSSRAAIAKLDQLPADRLDEFGELAAMVLRQLSHCLLQGGSYDAAVATINRSAALTKTPSSRNYALAAATGTYAFIGDLPAAAAARSRIDPRDWPRDSESSYLNAMARIGEGYLALDALEFERALDTIIESPSFTDTTEFWPLFTLVATHARFGLGDGLSAARWVEAKMNGVVPPHGTGENTATRELQGLLAIAWLAAGRIVKAERILAAVPSRAAEVAPARGLHLILTGRASAVVERLSGWMALSGHTARSRAGTLALGAVAARRVGDERLAVTLAAQAHDLHRAYGVHAHLVFLPAEDRRGLAELADRLGDGGTASYLNRVSTDVVPTAVPQILLSDRELAVLAELTVTGSREQIATRLGVSPNTVKTQLRSVYRKLDVASRKAAISAATEYELLQPPGGPAATEW